MKSQVLSEVGLSSLHPELAKPLQSLAQKQNMRPEIYLTVLLSTAASLIKPQSKLIISELLDWRINANFFGVVVGESGSTSVVESVAINPLQNLVDYELSDLKLLRHYRPQQPNLSRQRILCFSSATELGLKNQLSSWKNCGILWNTKSLHRCISFKKILNEQVSIIATVEPINRRRLQETGNVEFWAKMTVVMQPLMAMEEWPEGGEFSLSTILTNVYNKIDLFPTKQYRLSNEVDEYFASLMSEINELKKKEHRRIMKAVWEFSLCRTGKIALILHHINAAMSGMEEPGDEIQLDTMKNAWNLTEFYALQMFQFLYRS
ncbi:hypothetical protein [Laspinema olomoucense]|uniref:hypothetical protein n=1 Tax=Laspinema olomoucense TaxID=3231600 RepID=UPI0021BAB174|nr:hypothetical protein [Laspinema sp. D3d]MCT7971115.1 hypothetical protein [Laspinema sp. D3d]